MKKSVLAVIICLLSIAALGSFPASSSATTVVLGTEANSGPTNYAYGATGDLQMGGLISGIPNAVPQLIVASDGETSFDPFGAGYDTSDGIVLNAAWVANNEGGAFDPGWWTQLSDTYTWVLPAVLPSGNENEPEYERIGSWYYPGATWSAGIPDLLLMLEEGGQIISDRIYLNNDGPGGSAQILFDSNDVPEPSTMLLLGVGLAGVGLLRRRLKK